MISYDYVGPSCLNREVNFSVSPPRKAETTQYRSKSACLHMDKYNSLLFIEDFIEGEEERNCHDFRVKLA